MKRAPRKLPPNHNKSLLTGEERKHHCDGAEKVNGKLTACKKHPMYYSKGLHVCETCLRIGVQERWLEN